MLQDHCLTRGGLKSLGLESQMGPEILSIQLRQLLVLRMWLKKFRNPQIAWMLMTVYQLVTHVRLLSPICSRAVTSCCRQSLLFVMLG